MRRFNELNLETHGVKLGSMGLLDKAEKSKKKPVYVRVQAKVKAELFKEVEKILSDRGLTWQSMLHAAIESVKDEAKKR
jgi:hypothetical protein